MRGPRQIGKTSALLQLKPPSQSAFYLDDPNIRARAQSDPEFLLSQAALPTLLDEAHLAPELFYSIKKHIDQSRRVRLESDTPILPAAFRLTGSNQTQVDEIFQETLAGRVSIHYLHGLSLHELLSHDPTHSLSELLFRGGFPELWVRRELNPIQYFNDYISTFIEKDIARTAGIEKIHEFIQLTRLLAGRVGELLNYESLGNDAGITGKTANDWVSLLAKNRIVHLLQPFHSNLNKRLIKMKKPYFLDTGLCVRLQSHQEMGTLLTSAQAGHLFENLIVAEAIKTKDHFLKDWDLFFWRTKEKVEIDLIIDDHKRLTLVEIKLGSAPHRPILIPPTLAQARPQIRTCYVTASGDAARLSADCEVVPYSQFCGYLLRA